jgi:hypothetical protein
MTKHGTAKKRRRGLKVKQKQQKHISVRIVKSITNPLIRSSYDKTKTPKENMEALGFLTNANDITKNSENSIPSNNNNPKSAFVGYINFEKESTLESKDLAECNPKRKKISEFDKSYALKNIEKHGTNFEAMAKDIMTNDRQYTAKKIEKLCKLYLETQQRD